VKSDVSILITGACGDIGSALARQFAGAGAARLALCDLSSEADARPLIDELTAIGAKVIYRQVDITDADAIARFTDDADTELGGLDTCIANAGIVERGAMVELSAQAWRRTIEVNLTGSFLTAQASARAMLRAKRPGHIVFLSSWVQDTPRAGIGAYCASKGGLKMLAQCMALELGPSQIRVNLVAPGFVDAGLTGQNLKNNPHLRQKMESSIPLGRLISADELAQAIVMLCSEEGSYMTGATLLLDGGSSLFR
jgi:NAD(P)-dependent dehydrogenase (short-subunit alcohol dehydrogenase family)